jgi:hypothetical protein
MFFTKESLLGMAYNWLPESARLLSQRFPTGKSFDRFNGNAMLRMINLYNILIHRLTLPEAQSMEYALAKELPSRVYSEMLVFNWLKEKYLYEQRIN